MYSDDSGSDTSSERSLSPSPPSLTFSSSFENGIRISPKSRLSPPSTTGISLSPLTPPSSSVSPYTVICAYPSWPAGDFLSAKASSFSHMAAGQPNSRIPDGDLLGLEEFDLCDGMRVPTGMMLATPDISWEATQQPPAVVFSAPKRPSIGEKRKRRRSSALHRRRSMKAMSPIAEVPE
ncbi:MAG: hypothetical protein Q9226_005940 [Calogaya cf. arnoldii]